MEHKCLGGDKFNRTSTSRGQHACTLAAMKNFNGETIQLDSYGLILFANSYKSTKGGLDAGWTEPLSRYDSVFDASTLFLQLTSRHRQCDLVRVGGQVI